MDQGLVLTRRLTILFMAGLPNLKNVTLKALISLVKSLPYQKSCGKKLESSLANTLSGNNSINY
jgi:hypothetical protein